MNSLALEGDFLETHDGLIFDVKGVLHPVDRKIAYVRYVPAKLFHSDYENISLRDKSRIHKDIEEKYNIKVADIRFGSEPYVKLYDIPSRFKFLSLFKPEYIYKSDLYDFSLQAVPLVDIKMIHKPVHHLHNLIINPNSSVDLTLLNLIIFITKGGNISESNIGLSGSSMVGLNKRESDYDIVVYGESECQRVYSFLKGKFSQTSTFTIEKSKIKSYKGKKLRNHYNFRTKGFNNIRFQDFKRIEIQKNHQFIIDGREVFVRYVKFDHFTITLPRFEEFKFTNVGRISVMGTIIDDSQSYFTPGRYSLKISEVREGTKSLNEEVIEIFTLRGRFLEQARNGETVIVKGKLEFVRNLKKRTQTQRIVLGTDPDDEMIQINKSNKKFS